LVGTQSLAFAIKSSEENALMLRRLLNKIQRIFHPATVSPQPHGREPEVNAYGRQLSEQEIATKKHRALVGGLWDEIGQLQFEFMKAQGLLPEHKLLDIGCGAMRGGIHFVRYLNESNYYGLDINKSLIDAGKLELDAIGLTHKLPNLLINDKFEFALFNAKFHFAIAISLFTHLFINNITRCLVEVNRVLRPGGRFYATFFQSPTPAYLDPLLHSPGKITTYYDRDPFHYSFSEMQNLASIANLEVNIVKDWSHPRDQKMLRFTKLDG
jgi:ubiquinone/menaquinone biosynthesis C-methylase UbiE